MFAGGRLGPDGPHTLLKQFPIEKDIQVTENRLKKDIIDRQTRSPGDRRRTDYLIDVRSAEYCCNQHYSNHLTSKRSGNGEVVRVVHGEE